MSNRSSSGSSHFLQSQGTLEAALAAPCGALQKAPAIWSKAEETDLLEFLLKALPSSGDGGFKMPTFNQAAVHLKEKHLHQKGTEKTGIVCKNKLTALKKAYHSVINRDVQSWAPTPNAYAHDPPHPYTTSHFVLERMYYIINDN
ncbi:hypothetical protein BDR04DRAFT_1119394 [Suillus decipiens]|nr:hypothetical protein BDR04DRAFT_1119394 [Suillus decipiens]